MEPRHARILAGAAKLDPLELEHVFRAYHKENWGPCPSGCKHSSAWVTVDSPRYCVDSLIDVGYLSLWARWAKWGDLPGDVILELFITPKGEALLAALRRRRG